MLYILSTPIGNSEDISLRGLRKLKEADLILTEDTRKTGVFLKKLGLGTKPFLSFFEHNEEKRIPEVIKMLRQGREIVLISGAGAPLISDPGFKLARECVKHRIPFTALPGASSVLCALTLSGLPTHSFVFLGFLPRKKGKSRLKLEEIKDLSSTIVLFENPQRIGKTLKQIRDILGNRRVSIAREMTKKFEEIIRGDISEVLEKVSLRLLKGECTLVVEGKNKKIDYR